MKKILCIVLIFFCFELIAQNQEDNMSDDVKVSEEQSKIKRLAIGVKIGTPNMVGGAVEYVLPMLENHFAPYLNISAFDFDDGTTSIDLSYNEFGAKYYFKERGKGLFAGVGISKFSTSLGYTDANVGGSLTGVGSVDLDINTTILKLGIKTGGTIYFSLELGYGFGTIPDTLTFNATAGGITESVTEEIPDIPGIGSGGMVVGNIGFGFSF